jgi:cation diffusion facilitator CzcD-associated flavoprotein CzcO
MPTCDVAIIGAGPYGLSAAAHLAKIEGLQVRIFGEAMSFWNCNMPAGMLLRSNWTATHIGAPDSSLSLDAFKASSGVNFGTPVPLERFVEYGLWFQRRSVPDLDGRKVVCIERHEHGFSVGLISGDPITARRVIVAAGIGAFAWRPPEFQNISPSLASHTSEHRDLGKFAGKDIIVIGSGQSALESAALLNESGAKVEVIGRSQKLHWLQGFLSKTLHHGMGRLTKQLLYAPTDVGPAGLSQLLARPDLLRRLPRALQDRLRKRAVRPAGARWLVARLEKIPIRLGSTVVTAIPDRDRIKVKLSDGYERTADHVILGTGYRPDVSKYGFLSPDLVKDIDRSNGYPRLKEGLETTVPGLHILGAPAAWSFGPLMQFVSGTTYASRALTRSIRETRKI